MRDGRGRARENGEISGENDQRTHRFPLEARFALPPFLELAAAALLVASTCLIKRWVDQRLEVRGQWSIISGQWAVQWSVVSGQWSVVSGQCSVVSGQYSVVSGQWSVVQEARQLMQSIRPCYL